MKKIGLINLEYVNTVIKERPRDIHKGDCGKVLVIAGSEGMAGAAVLCARGALRAGAGLVRVSIRPELFTIVQISVPEATCIPRENSLPDLNDYDAIAVGPGLGDDEQAAKLIRSILLNYKKIVVLDADGINAISRYDMLQDLKNAVPDVVITPHPGEAKRLLSYTGISDTGNMDRQTMANALTEKTGCVSVLKGKGSIVTTVGGDSYINTTGNPGMAAGGSGDVLTGVIAALAGQGYTAPDSAKAGVFIHGLAGDLCADSLGEIGMTSMDLANMVALAFKQINQK